MPILKSIATVVVAAFLFIPTVFSFPEANLEWTLELPVGCAGSPVPYPSETPDSFVFGSGARVFRVSGTGKLIFDKEFGPENGRGGHYDPRVADLDGDGTEEIVAGHNGGYVYILNGETGDMIWQYELGASLETWRMATPADLDGDGKMEVIATDMDGWVTCLSHDGQLLWRSKVEDYRLSTPAVGDIDNDGQPEIVYGTATRHVIALEADGTVLWDSFQPPHHMGRTYPLIADLDEDGNAEIYTMSSMIGRDVGVVSLNGADGSLRWVGATWHKAYRGRGVVRFKDGTNGLLVCDKGNNVGAYQPDGKLRWKRTVGGRGIWTTPVCGDLDGDGANEIVVAVRGVSRDENQTSWYVLSSEGELLGSYKIGGGFGGAMIGDADRDGDLEVVLLGDKEGVHCYSFGGKATEDAVVSGSWGDSFFPLRKTDGMAKTTSDPIGMTFVSELPEAHYGHNRFPAKIPTAGARWGMEVTTQAPNLSRTTRVYKVAEGAETVDIEWPVTLAGAYEISLRLLDLENGKVVGQQELTGDLSDLVGPIARRVGETILDINNFHNRVAFLTKPLNLTLAKLETEVNERFAWINGVIGSLGHKRLIEHLRNSEEVDGFLAYLDTVHDFLDLMASEIQDGRERSIVLWRDENPWDNLDPLRTLPAKGGPLEIDAWAFGNEKESVGINVVNLAPHGVTIRVEPGTVKREDEEKTLRPALEVADLRRAVPLPSRYGEVVPDLLPSLGESYLLDIAPFETQRIWINLSSRDLEPGTYIINWPVRTLDMPPVESELTIRFTVSPVALPEKSRYLAHFWARNSVGDKSTVEDLNDHLATVWYGLPMPGAEANEKGELVGELDWTAHDEPLSKAKQIELILYSGPPSPKFPEGVKVTEELRLTADRNYAKALVEHLRTLGLDYENFMFYIEDETGLNAGPEHFIERASYLKKVDPRYQNYANPWGGITKEDIEAMWPYTDVWQPGMETIEYLGDEYLDAMRPGGKRVTTYTPPGNCRVLRPLGFFRAQAWQAFHWGIEGGGWWVYHGDDLWATDPDREPGYGGVFYDGRALVDSRRWEANRDGIEDFNVLTMLREMLETDPDAEAKQVLEEAVDYVASETITGMPREAADYDFDFAEFMDYRTRIRETLERMPNR